MRISILLLKRLTLLLLFIAAFSLAAAADRNQDVLELYVQDLVIRSDEPLNLPQSLLATEETGYSLVQYQAETGLSVYETIQSAGGKVYGPVAENGLLVGAMDLTELRAIQGVKHAMVFHPGFKLSPILRHAVETEKSGLVDVIVSVFEESRATSLDILDLGATLRVVHTVGGDDALIVTLPASQLPQLTALPHVRYVELAAVPLPELDIAPQRIKVRVDTMPPWTNHFDLDGGGQKLCLYDTGVDTGDTKTLVADLKERVTGDTADWTNPTMRPTWAGLNYEGKPSNHGTMVTDAAIGNGATSVNNLLTGVAFKASALIRPFNADADGLKPGYLNIARALTHAYNAGCRIHNNSWVPATGAYPSLKPILNTYSKQGSADIDTFARSKPTMLILTSAGNYGQRGANSIGTLSSSKNSLSVGNSGNGKPPTHPESDKSYKGVLPNQMAPSSSIGPVPGDRLKPEVNAPGSMVGMRCPQSTQETCADTYPYKGQPYFAYSTGTSFSTPLVSGTAILLRQLFARQSEPYLRDPTGMLLKALLINGASGIYNYAPDERQGWGRINFVASVKSPNGLGVMFYDSLREKGAAFSFTHTDQSVVFEKIQFSPKSPVMLTLTWYDPSDAGLSGKLINDLDLSLTLPDGTYYFGGVSSIKDGVTRPKGPRDKLNNSEKIILAEMPDGACTEKEECVITVHATRITPKEPQPFALVVSGVSSQGEMDGTLRSLTQLGLVSRRNP